ncbi:MAG TPA: pectate lyase, partial [Candidatus Sulfopaludibacter sp.]|nr:pectate lyase [Candidatus Sulfopaludibacter sp.]
MRCCLSAALAVACSLRLPAAVIGASTPAPPLTAERIAELPANQRAAWQAYLDRSMRQMQADRAALAAELKRAGRTQALVPPSGGAARSVPLDRPVEWYGGPDARRIADIVVSFQTPAGGWSKNLNLADHVRRPGEHFAPNNLSRFPTPGDFDAPRDPEWSYVGTLDNDATNTQLRFLAKVATAIGGEAAGPYRAAVLRGLDYLFAAQYPNGGWPQVWPLQGGYHDAITINDGAMTQTLEVLRDVAAGKPPFAFVDERLRKRAQATVAKGIACLLECQIVANGRCTVWGQQHDMLTLEPVAARNYEPAAQSSSESAGVLLLLMSLPKPDKREIEAVRAGVAWLQKTALNDKAYSRGPDGRRLVDAPGVGPIWARYYAIGTDRPEFGDRDKSIHDTVDEISRERRD